MLNIWYRIWFLTLLKTFTPHWSRYFKFVVFVWLFNIFPCTVDLSRLLKLTLYVRLSKSLWGLHVLLFFRIHKYSIHNFVEFIILLYTFLVIPFAWYKKYMIWRNLFSKFSDLLAAFTCTRAISKIKSICLGVNILSCFQSDTLATWPFLFLVSFFIIENIPLLKPLRSFYHPRRSIGVFSKVNDFFLFCLGFLAS